MDFKEHIESYKKANQKITWAEGIIMNSFVISHFSYCPVVWMFHMKGPCE